MLNYDVIVIGGGASGFFTAINTAINNPKLKILILEKGKQVLQKVKISGGGRCNVTHAEFIPNQLAKNYPRGSQELKGPFHSFMTGDVMEWFEERGVTLKIEADGRVFPVSNSSQTIIDCFLNESKKYGIDICTSQLVTDFSIQENKCWQLTTKNNQQYIAGKLVVATGSQSKIWNRLKILGLNIVAPVPSLFTFNCKDPRIENLPGIAAQVQVSIKSLKLKNEGAILITHWGFSGPAVLKLSAWGARELNETAYQFTLTVNWTNGDHFESCKENLMAEKMDHPKQMIVKKALYNLPKRLWEQLVLAAKIVQNQRWADLNKKQLFALATQLTLCNFEVHGKSTFKEEFVTAGGVDLKEINFKTYKANKLPNCFLVGEVLNVDAITGGFNFQNAWTSAFIASQAIAHS